MKIAIAQLNFLIGDFEGNVKKMITAVESAKEDKADIICFSELATCGYPARDFLDFDDFISLCENAIKTLTTLTTDIAIVVGSPTRNPVPEGKDLYNSAYFLADQKSFISNIKVCSLVSAVYKTRPFTSVIFKLTGSLITFSN